MAHDVEGLIWQYGTRTATIQFKGQQLVQMLPENYPHLQPFEQIIGGCTMPDANPDLPWLIRRHRQDHVAFWKERPQFGPHRLEDAEAGLADLGADDVLLIAGGWSAGENMALVRRWIGLKKPIVIAVNRAAVCWPDANVFFITERQANPWWWKHANKDSICVLAPSTNPEILTHFTPTQFAYFVTPWCFHDKWEDAPEWAYKPPMLCLPACETTLSMALAWTVRLKPKRVILLGVDHCWPAYATNHDNVWVPGPYYCDGYPWNGPEMGRRCRRGINGRYCVTGDINEKQALVTKTALEQIQINNACQTPVTCINASGHGILDFNADSLLFMRELDEAEAKDKGETAERLIKDRTGRGPPEQAPDLSDEIPSGIEGLKHQQALVFGQTSAEAPHCPEGTIPVSVTDSSGKTQILYVRSDNMAQVPQVSGDFPRSATDSSLS